MRIRLSALLSGLLLGVWVFVAYKLMTSSVVERWPDWARAAFVASSLLGVLGAPTLTALGLGLFDDLPQLPGEPRQLTAVMFASAYAGSLIVIGCVLMVLLAVGFQPVRAGGFAVGPVFLLIAIRRPWWLFASVRRVGWFAFLKDGRPIQWLFGVIGVAAVVVGFFGRGA